jgi:hypothetical protein
VLGEHLDRLTHAESAEATLALVGDPPMHDRIRQAATAEGVPVGALVAHRVRHLIDHGTEEFWLDLIGSMAATPEPGPAAIRRVLAHAFPDPVRVRVTHHAAS